MADTSIGISMELKEKLDVEKIHPRETYQDVIERLLKFKDEHKTE